MRKSVLLLIVPLMCLVLFPSMGSALGLEGVGGKVALIMPDGPADNNVGFGVIAELGTIVPHINQLKLETSADYWGDSYDVTYYEWSWSSISLNGTAKYEIPIGGNLVPFVGAGLSLVISRWKSEWKAASGVEDIWGNMATENSDSDFDIGTHICGGVNIPLGPGLKIIAEGRYAMGGTDTLQLIGGIVVKLK